MNYRRLVVTLGSLFAALALLSVSVALQGFPWYYVVTPFVMGLAVAVAVVWRTHRAGPGA